MASYVSRTTSLRKDHPPEGPTTVLGTCVATIDAQGQHHKARALVDNGSGLMFVTSRLVNSVKLKKIAKNTSVSGFQQTSTPISRYKVDFNLLMPSGMSTHSIPVRAVVVNSILPTSTLHSIIRELFLETLTLADLDFDCPGRVDLLLGVDTLHEICWRAESDPKIVSWVLLKLCMVGL